MKVLKRLALVLGVLVALVALGIAIVWWRLRQEPSEIAGTPAMGADEAARVLRELREQPLDPPSGLRQEWRAGSPIPSPDKRGRGGPPGQQGVTGTPYRLVLQPRQVAAVVVSQVARYANQQVDDVRVAVRDHDLFAAARLRGTALAGSVLSISAVPAAGRGGQLCLRLGPPHVGGQEIPARVVQQLGGPGASIPRVLCMSPRAVGLPGPVRSARVTGGGVVVDGVR